MRIVVVGGGSWGTAFSRLLADRGHDVTLACRDPEQARAIEETGRNPRYLRIVDLRGIPAAPLAEAPVAEADLVVVALPSRAFAAVVDDLPGTAPILSLTKGLQHATNSTVFRVYVQDDLVGVELCAAAKNVIALAAGGVDGLGLGDNAKAALISRGLAEMTRLGLACGARPETFAGLAGMGDLVVTCWSRHGRNRHAGELIARGARPDEAAATIGQVIEGLTTAPVLRDLSRRLGIELPITEGVCDVLEGRSLAELVEGLMGRRPTEE